MKVTLDNGAYMPIRAHELDAGYDLKSMDECIIRAGDSAFFDTGVHFEIPPGFVGMIKSKSGLNVKHGILTDGVVDSGYSGSVGVKLYNHSKNDFVVYKGDKIAQIVFMPLMFIPSLELVDRIKGGERGARGFGSTGRK